MLIDNDRWIKGIKVSKLKEILDKLDPDTHVSPNHVQNMTLYLGGKYLGYIDTLNDDLELIEPSVP